MHSHGLGQYARVLPGDYTELSGSAAARTLLDGDTLPTAVVAGNDQCAVGVLDELRRSGIDVPGQASIVGYDDSRLVRLAHVDLTTVRQDAEQLVRLAVAAVVELLYSATELDREPRVFSLSPHLVVRGSTTRPRA
ncbi:substrate-binding domain-containing protein [Rhodococcus sp. NPDC056960]|uniref:substrate-binding domain-containing protein n=1 Tax=Rhodococcus sp. NPDC056960 TaxID=3345982 RepID=UPI003641EA2D